MKEKITLTRTEYLIIKADIARRKGQRSIYRIVGSLLLTSFLFLLLHPSPVDPSYMEQVCFLIIYILFMIGLVLFIISFSLGLNKKEKALNEMWEGSQQEKIQLDKLFGSLSLEDQVLEDRLLKEQKEQKK
ncbi:MAG: hypothetical protein LBD11_07910 [Candidatus Peribacteria bacterium]|jgi:protein-S-isoprenylcysteine O-methyltransferase Ste14|nr:hypothetical protein [Candidatus Peribacteria bacterium]